MTHEFFPRLEALLKNAYAPYSNFPVAAIIKGASGAIYSGVNVENAKLLKEAGANALVAGSFVFNSKNPIETIQQLKSI